MAEKLLMDTKAMSDEHHSHAGHNMTAKNESDEMIECEGRISIHTLDDIKDYGHKTYKMLKTTRDNVECIKEEQKALNKKIHRHLSHCQECGEEGDNMNMYGNGIVPTMPINGNNCWGNNGFGDWGILMGLLFGTLFDRNRDRDRNDNYGEHAAVDAIDTNSILNGIQEANSNILRASADNQLATANQTASLQQNLWSGFLNMQDNISRGTQDMLLGNSVTQRQVAEAGYANGMQIQDAKYANTIATMDAAANLRNAMCEQGRFMDNNFARTDKELCQLGRAIDQNTFAISRQLSDNAAANAACCCDTQKKILESTYATSRQLDAMARENAECCCEQKLMNTMGFANVQTAIKDGFCDLKATLAQDKIDQLRIENAAAKDAIRDQSLANTINTTLTNGFTQLGAVFTSNVIPAIRSAVAG